MVDRLVASFLVRKGPGKTDCRAFAKDGGCCLNGVWSVADVDDGRFDADRRKGSCRVLLASVVV